MTNAGSGDFNLPFDMSSTVKEVDKQTKAAEAASRSMTNLEQHIRVISAAKKRIQQQQFGDILQGAQAVTGPTLRRANIRQAGGGFADPSVWGGGGNEHFKALGEFENQKRWAALEKQDTAKNSGLMSKFGKGLEAASTALSGFKAGLGIAAYAMVTGGAANYLNRGQEVSTKLGSLEIQSEQAMRHLGVKDSVSWIQRSGNVEGASSFINTALSLKTQQQISTPRHILAAGINAIRNGENPETVSLWLKTFQWNKIITSGSTKAQYGGRNELRRRVGSEFKTIEDMQRAGEGQRDAGAMAEAYEGELAQDHPVLGTIPGMKSATGWLKGKWRSKDDIDAANSVQGPWVPGGDNRPGGPTPVRQPNYDLQGGGRLENAADSLDRATQNLRGRPSWRVGNSPSSQ